jgi:hypothetical protein
VAGPNPNGFDPAAFEAGIRIAMQLGLPPDPARRPVFIVRKEFTSTENLDDDGYPMDSTVEPPERTGEVADVLCAYEVTQTTSEDAGRDGIDLQTPAITVTLLGTEYELVKDCIGVRISRDTYRRWHNAPDYGLGTSSVHQIIFKAGDLA